jgi:hypothetical protein
VSDASGTSAQDDQANGPQGTIDGYVLVGELMVILARPWTHGDQSGFTVEKVFALSGGLSETNEVRSNSELFSAISSETIARDIVSGKLIKLDSPIPIPATPPHQ